MKSDSHTSEKQKPQSSTKDDTRPPDKVRDAAWTFIEKIRQDDPTPVPAVESCDDQKRNGGSQIISAEQSGDRPPKNIPDATRTFIKELRESKGKAVTPVMIEIHTIYMDIQSSRFFARPLTTNHLCYQAPQDLVIDTKPTT